MVNPFKITAIILALAVVGILFFQHYVPEEISDGTIEIEPKLFEKITTDNNYNVLQICELDSLNCIRLQKLPKK